MQHTTVLREIVRQELEDVVFFAIFDPEGVAAAQQAGLNRRITLQLPEPEPMIFEGVVTCLSDGRGYARDDGYEGLLIEMGPSAVVSTGSIDLILISMPMEPFDIGCFEVFGIDPAARRFVVLKSRVHWRAAFDEMAATFVPCAGTGACTSDYDELDFQKVRRPMFPLDPQTEFVVEPAVRRGIAHEQPA
jgi:microcystin degradation protein MlrC